MPKCKRDIATPRENRFLMVQARRHPFVNATTLGNEFRNAVDVNVSVQTFRNHIQQSGLRSRRACIRIPLTRFHKQARLFWAQDHVNFTDNDWDPALFTDESRYCLEFTYRCARVWRRRNDFKMPTSLNMTAMMEAPSWCGLVSAEVEEQTCAHRDERHDDRRTLQG